MFILRNICIFYVATTCFTTYSLLVKVEKEHLLERVRFRHI